MQGKVVLCAFLHKFNGMVCVTFHPGMDLLYPLKSALRSTLDKTIPRVRCLAGTKGVKGKLIISH
jgi:hypothetical protein